MKSWDEVATFALTLPGTELSTSYRQPAIKVEGKMFVSTGHEADSYHVRSAREDKAVLIETDPDTFWQTPHYANWPGLLVRYASVDPDRVSLVITRAWWDAATGRMRREFGKRP